MDRKTSLILVLLSVILVSIVNAAVFTYLSMKTMVNVAGITGAAGAGCVGFYSSKAQTGIAPTYLPEAGTNYDAQTYSTNTISVSPGTTVCSWDNYALYNSIDVNLPITVGSWYIKDLYGFGYNGSTGGPTVYIWVMIDQYSASAVVDEAKVILFDANTGSKVLEIDLTTGTILYGGIPVALDPGQALQIDLKISATAGGAINFKIDFYVSQQPYEQPR